MKQPQRQSSTVHLSFPFGIIIILIQIWNLSTGAGASMSVSLYKDGFVIFWKHLAAEVTGAGAQIKEAGCLSASKCSGFTNNRNALKVNGVQSCIDPKTCDRYKFDAVVEGPVEAGNLKLVISRNAAGTQLNITADCKTERYAVTVSRGDPSMSFQYDTLESNSWSSTYSCQREATTSPIATTRRATSTIISAVTTRTIITPTTTTQMTTQTTTSTTTRMAPSTVTPATTRATPTITQTSGHTSFILSSRGTIHPSIPSTSLSMKNSTTRNTNTANGPPRARRDQELMTSTIVPTVVASLVVLVIIAVTAILFIIRRRRVQKKPAESSTNSASANQHFNGPESIERAGAYEAFTLERRETDSSNGVQNTALEPDNTSELSYQLIDTSMLRGENTSHPPAADIYTEVVKRQREANGGEPDQDAEELYAQVNKLSKRGESAEKSVDIPHVEMVENDLYGS